VIVAAQRAGSTAQRMATAARVVDRVVRERRSLDEALAGERSDPADRAAVQALAYGTIRWWPRFERYLAHLLERPAGLAPVVRALLGVGLHQLEHSSHPAYAVVDETVEATRLLRVPRASALVNAVLRRFLRDPPDLAREPQAPFAHPTWLIDALRADWPRDCERILDANNEPPPMWLRVNRRRTNVADYLHTLQAGGLAATRSERAPDALLLGTPVSVDELPGFEDGFVSVQDAAAQLTAPLLDLRDGVRVLDACAAPGGKSCQILEHARVDLVALDVAPERLEPLRENLARLSLEASVLAGDALDPSTWWDSRPFDRILLDAPCSATGVIRRHPDIKLLRRPTDIAAFARRQGALLDALWPLLAPGGRLLYATCSILQAENDAVVAEFLARTPAARTAGGDGLSILPGEAGMDGFHYACLQQRQA
jgi:16S rRNA (cytosine967-C5)-methyltransferase